MNHRQPRSRSKKRKEIRAVSAWKFGLDLFFVTGDGQTEKADAMFLRTSLPLLFRPLGKVRPIQQTDVGSAYPLSDSEVFLFGAVCDLLRKTIKEDRAELRIRIPRKALLSYLLDLDQLGNRATSYLYTFEGHSIGAVELQSVDAVKVIALILSLPREQKDLRLLAFVRKGKTVMAVKKGRPRKEFDLRPFDAALLEVLIHLDHQYNVFAEANQDKEQHEREQNKQKGQIPYFRTSRAREKQKHGSKKQDCIYNVFHSLSSRSVVK